MTAAFNNIRVLSLLLLLDLFCLSVAIGDHRAASAIEACARCESRPDVRIASPQEQVALLEDMRLHD